MSYLKQIFPFIQIVTSLLLIGAILLQQRGTGIGGALGGGTNVYASKRGLEKILFRATIVLATLFVLVAFLNLF